jgi:hypothetical protein
MTHIPTSHMSVESKRVKLMEKHFGWQNRTDNKFFILLIVTCALFCGSFSNNCMTNVLMKITIVWNIELQGCSTFIDPTIDRPDLKSAPDCHDIATALTQVTPTLTAQNQRNQRPVLVVQKSACETSLDSTLQPRP